jgi:hypothetical protein
VSPASHVWSTTIQVLATPALTKVESILPEQTMTIRDFVHGVSSAARTDNRPAVSSVRAMVPEQHPSMATALKELNSHKAPPCTNAPSGHSAAPAMQAIVVNCVAIVEPQLASVIGYKLEMVRAAPEDSQAACPTHREVIASNEARPFASCVAVVHHVFPTSHVWSPTVEVLASTTLTKIESIFPEQASAVGYGISTTLAACTYNGPSVSSIGTMVPEKHPSMTTTLKHLKPYKTPPCTNMLSSLSIAPTVQTIIIYCVAIVDPQLAAIIGDNAEAVMACPKDSHPC